MSEYQYYEFQAIDRPLTEQERKYISSLSSRTEATSQQAIFVYHYSSFRANAEETLAKYFDAMLYLANWGTARLMFRFPKAAIDVTLLSQYTYLDSIEIKHHENYVILDMMWNAEEGFGWVDGDGYLSKMLELRADIMRGDMRAPYLLWLKIASAEAEFLEEDEDLTEPPVPANLLRSSLALETLIDFFQIDKTLVMVAAEASETLIEPSLDISAGIAKLSTQEKDNYLRRVAKGDYVRFELIRNLQNLVEQAPKQTTQSPRRTISELTERADALDEAAELKRIQAVELKRNQYLDTFAKKIPETWVKIFSLIGKKQTTAYDEAIAIMVDLRDVAKRDGWEVAFDDKVKLIYEQYPTLRALHSRLASKGF